MKPLVFVPLLLVLACCSFAQETSTSQLQRLRSAYDSASQRALKPLTENYLKELNQLRDTYTRAVRLPEALQVEEEIKLVTARLGALGGPAPSTIGGRAVVLDAKAAILANDPNGYSLGAVRQGDVITVQYLEGKWKDHGFVATQNPDDPKRDAGSALVIARPAEKGKPGEILAVVPAGTAEKPFSYTVQTTRETLVLRINKNSDNSKNPGSVTYQVKLVR